MTDYIWQLGIDWNAIQTGGVGYLRGGLTTEDHLPLPGTHPVQTGDQITFRIFDVTSSTPPAPSGKWVTAIGSFGIDSQAAVTGQQSDNPWLSNTQNIQPTIGPLHEPAAEGSLFGNAHCSWDSEPVEVAVTAGRFLLTVYLQATGPGGVVRLFNHDPEMVVGGTGG